MSWGQIFPQLNTRISSITSSAYWKLLFRAKWVIIGITIVTYTLSWTGCLNHFETAGLDTLNILKAPKDPTHVVIVGITDDDYKKTFSDTSPLDSSKLQEIVCAIAKGNPKVIGVDIDTSADGFQKMTTSKGWPPVVWARDAVCDNKMHLCQGQPVLGGKDPASNKDETAIALLPQDSADGIIRRYHRVFPGPRGRDEDSFPWSIVKSACFNRPDPINGCSAIDQEMKPSNKVLRLNFAGERFNFTPLSESYVVQAAREEGWEKNGPLNDQIVLLGGYYRAGRDIQITPVGPMAGVQLMAQAIETEFAGGGIQPVNEIIAVILDLLAGAVLVYINYRYQFRLRKALLLSLLGLLALPLIFSYLAFSTLARWFNFVPIIVGVLLHEMYEHSREYQRLRERLARFEAAGAPVKTS